ncbi:O-methyltransferase [Kitasatospora cineracea]|uniref:Putative O-methyltransferase YrrM n=1 Tax=Kitasatospora cineracea TaxID=88074 RepID=A0A8G1UKE8_9ACTN|nr:class I SAM-dependent methyltransferase [Kitasatospora cineracea]ROR45586.1 putative O-methyltransferase YrrM [Kitasatospora cineracea]
MSVLGTASCTDATALPEPVARAVELAARLGFTQSCRPEQGRLLQALAAGASGRIGETGTGCGVGLAWLLAGRRPGVRVVSVEREPERVAAVRELFADVPDLEVLHGDWTLIGRHGPFDLLVLDGGGNGKQSAAADPERLLTPGGTLVVDDLTPLTTWPPTYQGAPDTGRTAWYDHPALLTTEIRLAPDSATLLATRRP